MGYNYYKEKSIYYCISIPNFLFALREFFKRIRYLIYVSILYTIYINLNKELIFKRLTYYIIVLY